MPLLFKSCWIFGVPSKLESGLLVCVGVLVKHLMSTESNVGMCVVRLSVGTDFWTSPLWYLFIHNLLVLGRQE